MSSAIGNVLGVWTGNDTNLNWTSGWEKIISLGYFFFSLSLFFFFPEGSRVKSLEETEFSRFINAKLKPLSVLRVHLFKNN